MPIDNNNDGVDDVTGKKIDTGTSNNPGSKRGIGSGGSNANGNGTARVTVINPGNERPADTAWAPKVDRESIRDNYIYSTGAVSQEVAMLNNPWSSAYNTWQTKSQLEGAWVRLSKSEQDLFNGIAAGRGHGSTGPGVFTDMIAESVASGSSQKSPVQIALEAVQAGRLPYEAPGTGGSGSSRSGASTAPRTTTSVSYMDKGSAEMLLNKLATDKLGRNLTDAELKKYTAEFHDREAKNATVTTTGVGSQVSKVGMADEDIAAKILMENPAFSDNVLKTDVVDMFFNRIGGKNA